MKAFIFTSLVAIAIGFADCVLAEDSTSEHPDRDDVTGVDGDDEEMVAAQKKALETLETFIEAIQNRDEEKRYLLKVRLEENEEVEHVWLEPVKWNDPGLLGVLAVDPVAIKKHKKGDVIAPLPSEVSDWVILSADGSKEGGFTMDVIEKRKRGE
ncbi:MAG: DUF2314 domain-containing protein [Verrucomicrobiota bacterium]